jgi:hypothetical protein
VRSRANCDSYSHLQQFPRQCRTGPCVYRRGVGGVQACWACEWSSKLQIGALVVGCFACSLWIHSVACTPWHAPTRLCCALCLQRVPPLLSYSRFAVGSVNIHRSIEHALTRVPSLSHLLCLRSRQSELLPQPGTDVDQAFILLDDFFTFVFFVELIWNLLANWSLSPLFPLCQSFTVYADPTRHMSSVGVPIHCVWH